MMNQEKEKLKNEGVKLTRGNVCYDFNISPFIWEVPYDNGETLVFVFSSNLYKTKFYNHIIENREKISESLSNRFGIKISNDVLCDIKLYSSIEKRGFLIKKGDKVFKCQEDIILDGGKVMNRS